MGEREESLGGQEREPAVRPCVDDEIVQTVRARPSRGELRCTGPEVGGRHQRARRIHVFGDRQPQAAGHGVQRKQDEQVVQDAGLRPGEVEPQGMVKLAQDRRRRREERRHQRGAQKHHRAERRDEQSIEPVQLSVVAIEVVQCQGVRERQRHSPRHQPGGTPVDAEARPRERRPREQAGQGRQQHQRHRQGAADGVCQQQAGIVGLVRHHEGVEPARPEGSEGHEEHRPAGGGAGGVHRRRPKRRVMATARARLRRRAASASRWYSASKASASR